MIYVDALKACLKTPTWRHRQSCHLFCDGDLRELHRFALRIGLKRAWFQGQSSFPHYDLTASKRELAVRMGVTEADLRTTGLWIRWWRQAYEENEKDRKGAAGATEDAEDDDDEKETSCQA